jgi:hypothetical protein
MAAYEVADADTFVIDSGGQGTTPAIDSGVLSLGGADCIIIAQMETDTRGISAFGPGYTGNSSDGTNYIYDEYHVTSVDEAATATAAGSANWGIIAAAFKAASGPPPTPAYCYRRTLTVDHTQCGASDSTDFPVLVRFTDATMKTVANGGHIQNTTTSNGQTVPADLGFYADSAFTTALNWEVEFYDGVNGILVAWVKLPTLSHTADTVFYMAYGDAGTTTFQGDVNGTWNSNFKGVWHLPDGTTLAATGSTATPHNGTITSAVAAAGNIDGAASFAGGTDKIDFGASADFAFAASFTVSAWVKTSTSQLAFLFGIQHLPFGSTAFTMKQESAVPQVHWHVEGATSDCHYLTGIDDGNWHHLVGQWDAGAADSYLYVDGVLTPSGGAGGASTPVSTVPLTVGLPDSGGTAFTGTVDELHAVNALLSADWIVSEFNSQMPASTFLGVSGETFLCGVTVVPTIYPDWLARVPQTRGWYAAPPAPPVAPPWISVDAPDQVRRGETGRLGWETRPLLPPPAPAPTYFTDTFPDQVRSGTKAPEGWYTRPTTPPPAPPLIETALPQARYSVPLTRTTYTAPVTPPPAPAPTYFVDVFPDQVRRAGYAAPDWLAEPILPPPVPYTEWGQTEPLHLRVSWRDLTATTEPLRIIQNPVPPLSWGVIYPDHLTVVRSAALLGAAYHAPYGPTPPPHERPLYRRSLQLRIGSRTEPEKL